MAKLSNIRTGTATSSTIMPLVAEGRANGSIGMPFFNYAEEKRYERQLLQKLENEVEVLAMDYGKVCESFVHQLLPKDYTFHSNKTDAHPRHPGWVGSSDGTLKKYVLQKWIDDAITDIKCPLTKKSFCTLVGGLYETGKDGFGVVKLKDPDMKKVLAKMLENANDGKKFYWQLVSNACIKNTKYAELIVFMPYYETMQKLIKYNESLDFETDENRHDGKPKASYLVSMAGMKENRLPFILKESGYEEINIIRFEVPVADKMFLERRFQIFDAIVEMSTEKFDQFMNFAADLKYDETKIIDLIEKTTKIKIK